VPLADESGIPGHTLRVTFDEVLDSIDGWAGEVVAIWWLDPETQRVFGRAEGQLPGREKPDWSSIDGADGEVIGFRIGEDVLLALYRNAFSKARWWNESLRIEFGPLMVTVERRADTAG
jgi:hypothetical protein